MPKTVLSGFDPLLYLCTLSGVCVHVVVGESVYHSHFADEESKSFCILIRVPELVRGIAETWSWIYLINSVTSLRVCMLEVEKRPRYCAFPSFFPTGPRWHESSLAGVRCSL